MLSVADIRALTLGEYKIMTAKQHLNFDQFASRFIHHYWSTIKDGIFSMPPNEPVIESLEELLSEVTHRTDFKAAKPIIHMTRKMGDWWEFGFHLDKGKWEIQTASARSEKPRFPHDLLDCVYAPYFKPLLDHVTAQANN